MVSGIRLCLGEMQYSHTHTHTLLLEQSFKCYNFIYSKYCKKYSSQVTQFVELLLY